MPRSVPRRVPNAPKALAAWRAGGGSGAPHPPQTWDLPPKRGPSCMEIPIMPQQRPGLQPWASTCRATDSPRHSSGSRISLNSSPRPALAGTGWCGARNHQPWGGSGEAAPKNIFTMYPMACTCSWSEQLSPAITTFLYHPRQLQE